ncbi:VirK family protein [Pandoraea sputorum]|uniref:VirK protein n=1 Tax=Pandoraea sputorum TaxID=93222 RepID=A0A5E5BEY7_9BURK|nr:VirK family protein [Pandoraea sputorum]VVE84459.1 VirK protein [Pandoraea sputorum]
MERKYSMPRRLVCCLTTAALVAAGWASAAAAHNAEGAALRAAVMAGKDIRAVLDLSVCTAHGTGSPGPAIRGSVHPNAFLLLKDGTVAFSDHHLTVRPDGKAVQEFVKYRVLPDGKVEFQTVVLDAANAAVLQTTQYDCALGKGLTVVW